MMNGEGVLLLALLLALLQAPLVLFLQVLLLRLILKLPLPTLGMSLTKGKREVQMNSTLGSKKRSVLLKYYNIYWFY